MYDECPSYDGLASYDGCPSYDVSPSYDEHSSYIACPFPFMQSKSESLAPFGKKVNIF